VTAREAIAGIFAKSYDAPEAARKRLAAMYAAAGN